MRFIAILFFIFAVLATVMAGVVALRVSRYRAVVVHHSAGEVGNYELIREFHTKVRGWSDAAYHLILSNGSTEVPEGCLEPTGRYLHRRSSSATKSYLMNATAVNICIVGNYQNHPVPPELQNALGQALVAIVDCYGLEPDDIVLHREVNSTACPGRHITRDLLQQWMRQARQNPSPELRAQYAGIVGTKETYLGYSRPRAIIGLCSLALSTLCLALACLAVRRE